MSNDGKLDLGVLLNLAFSSFRQALDADLAAAGYPDLGNSYGYVFRRLAGDGCSLTELAQHLSMTSAGALKLVNEMVDRGYVERADSPSDGRVKVLRLTGRGQAALRRAKAFHRRYEEALAQRMGPASVAAARAVLEAIVDHAPPPVSPRLPRPA